MARTTKQTKQPEGAETGLVPVLGEAVRRLTSQPLIFGIAVLLLLAIAAGLAIEKLAMLRTPIIIIFVLALAAWLIVELPKARAAANAKTPLQKEGSGSDVSVHARDVGKTGQVIGIEGLPQAKAPPRAEVDAQDIEGRVSGVRYESNKEKNDGRSSS